MRRQATWRACDSSWRRVCVCDFVHVGVRMCVVSALLCVRYAA